MSLFFSIEEPVELEELERRYVLRVLIHTMGNAAKAARVMKMDRRTFYRKHGPLIKSTRESLERISWALT